MPCDQHIIATLPSEFRCNTANCLPQASLDAIANYSVSQLFGHRETKSSRSVDPNFGIIGLHGEAVLGCIPIRQNTARQRLPTPHFERERFRTPASSSSNTKEVRSLFQRFQRHEEIEGRDRNKPA